MMNKAIIITGANGNIGSFFAKRYFKKDDKLILCIHENSDRIANILDNENVRIIKTNLVDLSNFQTQLNEILTETNWHLDRMIHTTTIRSHDFKPLAETDAKLWENIIRVNVMGTFNILKTLIPVFRKNGAGKIVLFGSNVTRIGLPFGSAYSASKAALANITRTVAAEEGQNNIIVNIISPGPVKIDDSHFSESYRKFREEYYRKNLREIPLQRCASFEDLFGLCNFLLSAENSYITGEEFFVTGGKV
ncbi:MAG: SDR family oxidoreductase [Candidatus Cloacimonetes bacterium]|nr:SDR family oxidoreductase [Candidatus Cloacimonadota bacterium]